MPCSSSLYLVCACKLSPHSISILSPGFFGRMLYQFTLLSSTSQSLRPRLSSGFHTLFSPLEQYIDLGLNISAVTFYPSRTLLKCLPIMLPLLHLDSRIKDNLPPSSALDCRTCLTRGGEEDHTRDR